MACHLGSRGRHRARARGRRGGAALVRRHFAMDHRTHDRLTRRQSHDAPAGRLASQPHDRRHQRAHGHRHRRCDHHHGPAAVRVVGGRVVGGGKHLAAHHRPRARALRSGGDAGDARVQHGVPTQGRQVLSHRPGRTRQFVGSGARKFRRSARGEGIRGGGSRDRTSGDDLAPPERGAHARGHHPLGLRGSDRRDTIAGERRHHRARCVAHPQRGNDHRRVVVVRLSLHAGRPAAANRELSVLRTSALAVGVGPRARGAARPAATEPARLDQAHR